MASDGKTVNHQFRGARRIVIGRCPGYAEALRGLWPPSVVVPSVAGGEGIRLPFAGGDATWGCVNPHFFSLAIEHIEAGYGDGQEGDPIGFAAAEYQLSESSLDYLPPATATKPAINAYSMRSCELEWWLRPYNPPLKSNDFPTHLYISSPFALDRFFETKNLMSVFIALLE